MGTEKVKGNKPDISPRRVHLLVIRFFARFLIFLAVWCIGCYLADYVFKFSTHVWTMAWGFLVGTIAWEIRDVVKG